jgi:lysophospholipase L1-like esterase
MTEIRRRRGGAALLALGLVLAAGCGGGRAASTTTPTTETNPRTPADFDFGANSPRRATAFGDSITLGEIGSPSLRTRTAPRVTRSNYPNGLQSMLRGLDPTWRVVNRGVGGETTEEGRRRLPGVLNADKPGFVLIMEGTNDASLDVDPDTIVANLGAMLDRVQANHSIPILATIPPNFRNAPGPRDVVQRANDRIRTLARDRNVVLAEIFEGMNDRSLFSTPSEGVTDPLHPNERGYSVMAGIWFEAIQKAVPVPAPPTVPPSGIAAPPAPMAQTRRR